MNLAISKCGRKKVAVGPPLALLGAVISNSGEKDAPAQKNTGATHRADNRARNPTAHLHTCMSIVEKLKLILTLKDLCDTAMIRTCCSRSRANHAVVFL